MGLFSKNKKEKTKAISTADAYREMAGKITVISDAIKNNDYSLLNEYTGQAINLIMIFKNEYRSVEEPLKKLDGKWIYTQDDYPFDGVKNGDTLFDAFFDVITGRFVAGNKLLKNNIPVVYKKFKKLEKNFPDALILLFNLT